MAIGCNGNNNKMSFADTGTDDNTDCEKGTVSGTVTDVSDWDIENGHTGNIQPNARVLAQNETGFTFETVAGADGTYTLELDAGSWRLSAGPDQTCFGDEVEVDIGCIPVAVNLSVVSCMGR